MSSWARPPPPPPGVPAVVTAPPAAQMKDLQRQLAEAGATNRSLQASGVAVQEESGGSTGSGGSQGLAGQVGPPAAWLTPSMPVTPAVTSDMEIYAGSGNGAEGEVRHQGCHCRGLCVGQHAALLPERCPRNAAVGSACTASAASWNGPVTAVVKEQRPPSPGSPACTDQPVPPCCFPAQAA